MDAITRIKQLGMPRRNNELWTFKATTGSRKTNGRHYPH